MKGIDLRLAKAPNLRSASDHLAATGLALEYFPAFLQDQHDFHTHEFIEILFVFSGRFRHVAGEQVHDETPGAMTIINQNQFHTLKTRGEPVELMNLYWDPLRHPAPALPEPLPATLQQLFPAHPLLGHRLNRLRHLHFGEESGAVAWLLRRLYAEQQNPAAGSEAAIDALFRLFLVEVARAAPDGGDGVFSEPHDPRMERIRAFLDKHHAEPVRLEQLCELAGLGKANLCRRFKRHTGLGTGDYLKRRRLAAALHMLRTTSHKIATVCLECGFSDVSNFNRTFRAVLGQSPSQYRRSLRRAATPPARPT